MRKLLAICFVAVIALWCGRTPAQAQDEREQPEATDQAQPPASPKPAVPESKAKADQHPKPIQPYRLDFSLNELEDGKKINSRHYSMNLTAGSMDEIRIGTRVPVAFGSDPSLPEPKFQYVDVGTKIWADLREGVGEVQLEVRSEISNVDVGAGHEHASALPPIIRTVTLNGTTLLVTGKPMIIGSVDDPNSNREFQLEVTATKLK